MITNVRKHECILSRHLERHWLVKSACRNSDAVRCGRVMPHGGWPLSIFNEGVIRQTWVVPRNQSHFVPKFLRMEWLYFYGG